MASSSPHGEQQLAQRLRLGRVVDRLRHVVLLPAPPCPAVRPGRSRLVGSIAVVGVVALIGCGGGDGTTTPATTALTPEQVAIGLDHPLCSEIESIEDLPEDGNCRERPTCQEVDDGAELPADGVCLDVTEP